jgi:hypothetical protein
MSNSTLSKTRILVMLAVYLPGYKSGGPVRTIANLVEHLGDEFEFYIITNDRDVLDTEPYPSIQVDEWNSVGKAMVYYTSPAKRSLGDLTRLIKQTPHDVLYLNSFYMPTYTLLPLFARRFGWLPEKRDSPTR